jgi:ABC-2 type transport system permease protein
LPSWLSSFGLLVQWETIRLRVYLPIIVLLQAMLGAATIVGMAFLLPNIDPTSAVFLATAGPTLALLSIGFNQVPNEVGQAKLTGAWDYMASLPAPRLAYPSALLGVQVLASLPGMLLTLVVASLRFEFDLSPHPLGAPAGVLVIGVAASAVGFLLAMVMPNPLITNMVSAVMLFFVLLFSPITFPADRLPGWLAAIHEWLPFEHMADLMRATLTGQGSVLEPFVVVGVWCAAALAALVAVCSRRP